MLVTANCDGPSDCSSAFKFYWSATADSSTTTSLSTSSGVQNTNNYIESSTTTSGATVRSTVNLKLVVSNSMKAGTYRVTVYSKTRNNGDVATTTAPVVFTVTVTAASVALAGVNAYVYDAAATGATDYGQYARKAFKTLGDSTTSYYAGLPGDAVTAVAHIFGTGKNAAGDTTTATGLNICATSPYCVVTAVVTSGPAALSLDDASGPTKTATWVLQNGGTLGANETLTVWTDGSGAGGTATISYYSGTTLIGSKTVKFYADPASAVLTATDTGAITSIGAGGPHFTAAVKDATGNAVTSGTIYVYSSDTKVVSDSATACAANAAGVFSCKITAVDTGTVSIRVRDAATVGASTFVSDPLSIKVTSNVISTFTATFDKTNYVPGEKAILTITAKDRAGSLMDGRAVSSAFVIKQNLGFSTGGSGAFDQTNATTFTPYYETGVETRVVYMPSIGGTLSYEISAGSGATIGTYTAPTVTVVATITDPTKDAADAATDAALEATDAAYAAQDAAQLAAEAADAATAAAEAATAAVEDLATQVASLFADLQKQITTLANVVAKIAKKVKA